MVMVGVKNIMADKQHNFKLSVVDTDSIAFSKADGSPWTPKETKKILLEINSLMRPGIEWADDGLFKKVIVVKAKNYILQSLDGKTKFKGSGLKGTKKEPKLKEYSVKLMNYLLDDKIKKIPDLYFEAAKEIYRISDLTNISDYAFKATITKSVLEPKTTFNKRIFDALVKAKVEMVEGDKHYFYFLPAKIEMRLTKVKRKDQVIEKMMKYKVNEVAHISQFDGSIDKAILLKKLFATTAIFKTVIPDFAKMCPNLNLKRNESALKLLMAP